jgi:HEAT repeat protein
MTKRLLLPLGAALLILALAGVWLNRPERPVVYQGKDVWTWTLQLESPTPADRQVAIAALHALGPAAVPPLVSKLRAGPSLARQVREWLGARLPGALGRNLTKNLPPTNYLETRGTAAAGLKVLGTNAAPAVPALLRAMRGGEPRVLWNAAGALGDIGGPAALGLVPLLNDPNPLVRRGAIFALGEMGPAALPAVPALVRQLGDNDPTYRGAIAFTLSRIGPVAGPGVMRLFAESRGETRKLALQAAELVQPRPTVTMPVLLPLARAADAESRRAALEALGTLRVSHTNALVVYRAALDDPEPAVRAAAARALGAVAWRARGDLTLLSERALGDGDASVRAAAQLAVEKIKTALTNAAPP